MVHTRTVVLEILRHGPPYGHLLSPLTRYMGLCGNEAGVAVQIPYEHRQFLARHEALNYGGARAEDAQQKRELVLQLTAHEMAQIIEQVPGLISELGSANQGERFVNLEIVLSASELALLPFELADSPSGFPGAGQPLALQSEVPLCITRRVRRVRNETYRWPETPKILFAVASPSGLDPVPFQSHLAALLKVISPWVWTSADDQRSASERYRDHLTILPDASERTLSAALRTGEYTHVHLLMHGLGYREGVDERFGLAMHDSDDPTEMDVLGGTRLANIFRAHGPTRGRLVQPAVVTVASCYGGGQGSVIGAGSSVAHALHEAGVPLVVSSQFPLSYGGSVLFAWVLYEGLLWGEDPRVLVNDLRRRLRSRFGDTHDWASMVVYAALPERMDRQLHRVRFLQARRCINAAFHYFDRAVWSAPPGFKREADSAGETDPADARAALRKAFRTASARLEDGKRVLEELIETAGTVEQASLVHGRLAATAKREAEVDYKMSTPEALQALGKERLEGEADRLLAQSTRALDRARKHYRQAFQLDRRQGWALVQEVALSLVLRASSRTVARIESDATLTRQWWLAKLLCETDLHHRDEETRAWARGGLIELNMLSLLIHPQRHQPNDPSFGQAFDKAQEQVEHHTDRLLAMAAQATSETIQWELVSRHRQSLRYLGFFFYAFTQRMTIPTHVPEADREHFAVRLVQGLAYRVWKKLPPPPTGG